MRPGVFSPSTRRVVRDPTKSPSSVSSSFFVLGRMGNRDLQLVRIRVVESLGRELQ